MKKKMIIVGTDDGIILDVSRCAIFDENELSEADQTLLNFGTESDALSVANRHGIKLSDILEGCGYGDLNYYNSLALSPLALRSEFAEFPELLPADLDGVAEVKAILEWGSKLSDTQLMNLAAYALQDDDLWNQWRTTVVGALQEFYTNFQEASKE
jgi:hypothetical protein